MPNDEAIDGGKRSLMSEKWEVGSRRYMVLAARAIRRQIKTVESEFKRRGEKIPDGIAAQIKKDKEFALRLEGRASFCTSSKEEKHIFR